MRAYFQGNAMRIQQEQFEQLLPLAVAWVKAEEQRVLQKGLPLSESQLQLARQIPVRHPEKVRLLSVSSIPFPRDPSLQQAAVEIGLLTNLNDAVMFGYGICLCTDQIQNRFLLTRELVLVARHEEMGGIEPFLREYLSQVVLSGSDLAPMEVEAGQIAEQIVS